jgi:acyl phosphate:glycerol-3-phosphate acyltransferase
MLVIFPPAILVGAPVFVGVILATRYVSLGSLLATAAGGMLVVVWWLAANGSVPFAYPVYATLGAALVWLAHADNIDRLIHGTERRFDLDLLARD